MNWRNKLISTTGQGLQKHGSLRIVSESLSQIETVPLQKPYMDIRPDRGQEFIVRYEATGVLNQIAKGCDLRALGIGTRETLIHTVQPKLTESCHRAVLRGGNGDKHGEISLRSRPPGGQAQGACGERALSRLQSVETK